MKKSIVLLALIVVATCHTAFGQAGSGTITGTVLDASGSAIPSTKVTATNIETNVATSVETTGAGVYLLPGLDAGKVPD